MRPNQIMWRQWIMWWHWIMWWCWLTTYLTMWSYQGIWPTTNQGGHKGNKQFLWHNRHASEKHQWPLSRIVKTSFTWKGPISYFSHRFNILLKSEIWLNSIADFPFNLFWRWYYQLLPLQIQTKSCIIHFGVAFNSFPWPIQLHLARGHKCKTRDSGRP